MTRRLRLIAHFAGWVAAISVICWLYVQGVGWLTREGHLAMAKAAVAIPAALLIAAAASALASVSAHPRANRPR